MVHQTMSISKAVSGFLAKTSIRLDAGVHSEPFVVLFVGPYLAKQCSSLVSQTTTWKKNRHLLSVKRAETIG
jgi:hypothetical protein